MPQLAEAADVVDVSVSADDGFDRQPVPAEQLQDARDFVTRINHERLSADWVSDDRAIALQHPDRNGDVDESLRDSVEGGHGVAHEFRLYHPLRLIQECGRHGRLLTLLS